MVRRQRGGAEDDLLRPDSELTRQRSVADSELTRQRSVADSELTWQRSVLRIVVGDDVVDLGFDSFGFVVDLFDDLLSFVLVYLTFCQRDR